MYISKNISINYKNQLLGVNKNNKNRTNFSTTQVNTDFIGFKSTKRSLVNDKGIKINSNYTNMLRNDVDWDKLTDFIINNNIKYIYSLAASDGSEAYSIAIKLIERLGEESNKFKPIYAIDADEYIINLANSGYIGLRKSDVEKINKATNNNFSKYFRESGNNTDKNGYKIYKVNEILRDFVVFNKCDACEFVKKKIPSDSLLLPRNFWFYLPLTKQLELAKNLYKNTSDNTYIILGSRDLESTDVIDYLKNAGFEISNEKIILPDPPSSKNKFIGAKIKWNEVKNGVLYKKLHCK